MILKTTQLIHLPVAKKTLKLSHGFTIIETLLAIAVFSLILILLVTGVMQISRSFMRGVNTTALQSTTRSISDRLSQDLQVSTYSGSINQVAELQYFCVGGNQYVFTPGVEYTKSNGTVGLVVTRMSTPDCSAPALPLAGQTQLLSEHTRVLFLKITRATSVSTGSYYKLSIALGAGASDLFCLQNDATCEPASSDEVYGESVKCQTGSGSEFCAVSKLNVLVQPRI